MTLEQLVGADPFNDELNVLLKQSGRL